jgi:DNA-binding transcriptional LysR family regulator
MTAPDFKGEVRLGVPHDIVGPYMPPVLKSFDQAWPGVRVSLVCSTTPKLLRAPRDRASPRRAFGKERVRCCRSPRLGGRSPAVPLAVFLQALAETLAIALVRSRTVLRRWRRHGG